MARHSLEVLRHLAKHHVAFDLPWPVMEVLAKQAMVEAAATAAVRPAGTTNQSRVAAITGMPRPEVARVLARAFSGVTSLDSGLSRAATLVRAWTHEPSFRTAAGKPRVLTLHGTKGTFANLARKYGGDVPPAALLARLVALRLVRVSRSRDSRSTDVTLVRASPLLRDASEAMRGLTALASLATTIADEASSPTVSEISIWSTDAKELEATRNTVAQRTEIFLRGLSQALSSPPRRGAPSLRLTIWSATGKRNASPRSWPNSSQIASTKPPRSRGLDRDKRDAKKERNSPHRISGKAR